MDLSWPQAQQRSGRLPERTIYELTDAGHIEMHDWLTELVSTPVKDYPGFEAALRSFPPCRLVTSSIC